MRQASAHSPSTAGTLAPASFARTAAERPHDPAHWDVLADIAKVATVPLVANGDITAETIPHLRAIPGVASLMLARAAQWNPSVFRVGAPLEDLWTVSQKYLAWCLRTGNPASNTKYALLQMWIESTDPTAKGMVQKLQAAKTTELMCRLFGVPHGIIASSCARGGMAAEQGSALVHDTELDVN